MWAPLPLVLTPSPGRAFLPRKKGKGLVNLKTKSRLLCHPYKSPSNKNNTDWSVLSMFTKVLINTMISILKANSSCWELTTLEGPQLLDFRPLRTSRSNHSPSRTSYPHSSKNRVKDLSHQVTLIFSLLWFYNWASIYNYLEFNQYFAITICFGDWQILCTFKQVCTLFFLKEKLIY